MFVPYFLTIFLFFHIMQVKETNTMSIIPYVNFNGNAKDALHFYQEVFQSEPAKIMTYHEMPKADELPDYMQSMVLHAELHLDGSILYVADTPNDGTHPYLIGNQVTLSIQAKTVEYAKKIYDQLSLGGITHTPLGPTFFSPAYAEFSDKFHLRWMIITE
ncbi:MAG: VOC family protein [Acholeplasma sp.]|nr:MAG: VOC family protein [Acholeplasma sp.]